MDKLIKIVDILGSVVDALSVIHAALSGITSKLKNRPSVSIVPDPPAAAPVGE